MPRQEKVELDGRRKYEYQKCCELGRNPAEYEHVPTAARILASSSKVSFFLVQFVLCTIPTHCAHSSESLCFWLEVEFHRKHVEQSQLASHHQYLVETFLSENAPRQINISPTLLEKVGSVDERTAFDALQMAVVNDMAEMHFNFIHSHQWRLFLGNKRSFSL